MNDHFIIKRKVLISMIFLASSLLGFISWKQLKMEILPNADLPVLFVRVSSNIEITPDYLEQEAIIPVESAVAGLENIERIESTAGRRQGMVIIYYEKRTDLKYAYLKLDERISSLKGKLPEGFNLQVQKVDTDNSTDISMQISVLGEGGVDRVRNFVDQYISEELLNIEGVGAVNVYGGRQKSVDVILNRSMCDAYRITPSRVRTILSRNMSVRQYGGLAEEKGLRYFIYMNAEYQDISQIEDLVIGQGQNALRLKDIATVYYGEKEEETISRINGKNAVSINVIHDAQANMIDLSHELRDKVKELNQKYEQLGIELIVQDDTAESMENNIDQIINLAVVGGLMAVFVLWVFLRNLRLVTVVALAIPISVYTAFNFFFAYDISVNSLTLMGIALAVGMLLDTSVVVLENIYRLRTAGYKRQEAVVKGTKEVWRAIIASTLTTVSVFIPFVFSSDYMIKLFGKHIGVSIISTLLVSLAVSLLLIPMIVNMVTARRSGRRKDVYKKVTLDNKGIRIYLSLLKTVIRNPGPTIIGVVILFFLTIVISMSVSVNKLNELEANQIDLYITMRTGTTLETTDGMVAQVEEALKGIEEADQIISGIEEEEAIVTIILKEDYQEINRRSFGEIQAEILERTKDIPVDDISTSASTGGRAGSGGGGGGGRSGNAGFSQLMGIGQDEEYLVLKGQDFDLMVEVAEDIETYLEDLDNINAVRLSIRENQPEVHMELKSLLMSQYGITRNDITTELNSFMDEVSSGVNFRQGEEEYEIIIRYDDASENDEAKKMDDLKELDIPGEEGETMYEVQELADVYFASGMREISRVNQEKQVELRYYYNDDVYDSNDLLEYARSEIRDVIRNANIPPGIATELVQEESEIENEFKRLFIIALFLVYMILAALFESFLTPFVLLLSIPFAAIGSFFLLTVTGNSLFNANTMMGFMILLGVVVNNAIILIDFINVLRKRGYRRYRAIITSGMSRVRPILITTITTCVAMIPLAMGKAEYVKAIGPPFAITVIGGLLVSTVLTLVFIPMMYNGLEQAVNWFRGLKLFTRLVLVILVFTGILMGVYLVDSMLWSIAAVLLAFSGIPLTYYFISSSLRKASGEIIPHDQPLKIQIENLVKIYGRRSRAYREFASGRRFAVVRKNSKKLLTPNFDALIWQLPLLAFLVYFSWFYLVSNFWQLISAVIIYLYVLMILKDFNKFLNSKWIAAAGKFIQYAGPAVLIGLFSGKWNNNGLVIFSGTLWYLALAVFYVTSLYKSESFDLKKVPKIFRWFVKVIGLIPGIGSKRDEFKALKGVSLEIGTGMFGLLGPNGAGKSTMIRIICGILEQSYGKIWINGIDTQEKREELQGLIGYLPQEFGMYENMPAEEYLEYQAILKGITNVDQRRARIREVLEAVHMWDQRRKKIGAYSGGMKQRIGIAQVLLHLPRILVVDEPTAGLDPRERIRFRNLLVELSRSRIVIFSTHIIEDISSSCTTMAVINKGEVLFNGTPSEMTDIANGKVWKAFILPDQFEEVTRNKVIVNHMRDEGQIRVRCISGEKPFENATEEIPVLEDAYLWLLQSSNGIVNLRQEE